MTTEKEPKTRKLRYKFPQEQPTTPKTKSGEFTKKLLLNFWDPLDLVGKALMGELWRDVYLTIQDAISLGILFVVFGWIFQRITGENFTGFDQCMNSWNIWEVNRYFCFVVVGLAFCSCISLGGRFLIRFSKDLIAQLQSK